VLIKFKILKAQILLLLAKMAVFQHQEVVDFDESFKQLLQPIESITKKDECEIFQYDLIKVNFNTKLHIHICNVYLILVTRFLFKTLEEIFK